MIETRSHPPPHAGCPRGDPGPLPGTDLERVFQTSGGGAIPPTWLRPLPFTTYDSRFTTQMIGFDRSAFVAGPDLSGLRHQNVNRVTLQFMTKVFRSVLSKIRSLTDLPRVHQSCNQQRSEILAEQLVCAQGMWPQRRVLVCFLLFPVGTRTIHEITRTCTNNTLRVFSWIGLPHCPIPQE